MTAVPVALGGRFAFAGDPPTSFIDLGTEPPLTIGSPSVGAPAARAVSIRWLSGTILTGITAFVLMGGALAVALNGQQLAAAPPESVDLGALSNHIAIGEKGDRILPVAAEPATREIIPVAVTVREGDRDLIQQRNYAFVNTPLAAASADGVDVPPYDPVTVVGDAANAEPTAPMPDAADEFAEGDVAGGNAAVRTTPFPLDEQFDAAPVIPTDQIVQIVHANAGLLVGGQAWPTLRAYANAGFAGINAGATPLAAAGFRAIPENVSYLTKSGQAGLSRDERVIPMAEGVTLASLLADAGAAQADIVATVAVMEGLIDLTTLTPEDRVRIAFVPGSEAEGGRQLLRVSIYENDVHQATVARDDSGTFVRADEPGPLPEAAMSTQAPAAIGTALRVYDALYLTGIEQGLPADQINELIRIFAFDVDMLARIGPADTVQLFYGLPAADAGAAADSDPILYASVTLSGVTTTYYRFQTDDGSIHYYDADGRSANNFLLRKPISGGQLTSRYGMRVDPVTGVYQLHSGVDYAAPRGTPIVAAGDGVIERISSSSQSGGYGNFTIIRHANGYETAYGHQSAFAQGLSVGEHVVQGQVIGYVGTTGQSTGNHLHFEIRINGQTVNPLTIRLPEGGALEGDQLTAFKVQRDQIELAARQCHAGHATRCRELGGFLGLLRHEQQMFVAAHDPHLRAVPDLAGQNLVG